MASKPPIRCTPRDEEILLGLDHTPMTAVQLCALSETFGQPFTHEKFVRRRLHRLAAAGWVHSWPLATTSRGGAAHYYKLTLNGYRLLHGSDVMPPTRRYFSEVNVGHHRHLRSLADFIVHTSVGAYRAGVELTDFCSENTLRLPVGNESLLPDCAFRLQTPDGEHFNFVVELDNSTERIRSVKDIDSWQRKVRLYDQYQRRCKNRFRVLVVTTRSQHRVRSILAAAAEFATNQKRSLFYGVHLPEYQAAANPLRDRCFADHRGRAVALLKANPSATSRRRATLEPFLVATSGLTT